MKSLLAAACILASVSAHSWITRPTAHNVVGGRGNLEGPCDVYKGGKRITDVKAGSKVNAAWPPMGHSGGYVRFALAPKITADNGKGTAQDQAALSEGVIQTSCYGGGACGTCVNNRPGSLGIKRYNVDVKIPSNIKDGVYTLQAYLVGTGNGLPDYFSCSDLNIFGGDENEVCTPAPPPMEKCWHCTQSTCDPKKAKLGDLSQSQNTKWCFNAKKDTSPDLEVHRKHSGQYCSNRLCFGTKCTESTMQGSLQDCAKSVKANAKCGNSFSYGSDNMCDCAGPGVTCIPKANAAYSVYELSAGQDDSGGSDTTKPIVIDDGGLKVIVDDPCLNDYAAVGGDTLTAIANKHGTTVDLILDASGTEDNVYCAKFTPDECPRQCDKRGETCEGANSCAWQCTGTLKCLGFLKDCVEVGHQFLVPSADCTKQPDGSFDTTGRADGASTICPMAVMAAGVTLGLFGSA